MAIVDNSHIISLLLEIIGFQILRIGWVKKEIVGYALKLNEIYPLFRK